MLKKEQESVLARGIVRGFSSAQPLLVYNVSIAKVMCSRASDIPFILLHSSLHVINENSSGVSHDPVLKSAFVENPADRKPSLTSLQHDASASLHCHEAHRPSSLQSQQLSGLQSWQDGDFTERLEWISISCTAMRHPRRTRCQNCDARGGETFCDIYRSPNTGPSKQVPALLAFNSFGKMFSGLTMLNWFTPWNVGVPDNHLSGLENFEAPDPAEWIPRGYTIINADTRGTGDSDGPCVIMDTQEGEDGYDTIKALAKMEWCNGAVGMVGNSHLAITQYFFAAQRPPSLKAIAP